MNIKKATRYNHEKRLIYMLYVLFFGSLTISFLSPPPQAILSMMVCICVLSGIYSARLVAPKDSLLANHTTFLIRTFWRANLYLVYTLIPAVIFIVLLTDYAPLKPCIDYVSSHWMTVVRYWGVESFAKLFKQCSGPFVKANLITVVFAMFIMVFPVLIYLLNRLILGWSHIMRGIQVSSQKL